MSTSERNNILYKLATESRGYFGATARALVLRNREFEEPVSLRELVEVAQRAFPLLLESVIWDEIIYAIDTPERWELVERLRYFADKLESGAVTGVPSSQGTFVTENDRKVFKDCVGSYDIIVPAFTERPTKRERFILALKEHFKSVDSSQVTGCEDVVFQLLLNVGEPGAKELYISWLPSGDFALTYYYSGTQILRLKHTSLKDLILDFKDMFSISKDLL